MNVPQYCVTRTLRLLFLSITHNHTSLWHCTAYEADERSWISKQLISQPTRTFSGSGVHTSGAPVRLRILHWCLIVVGSRYGTCLCHPSGGYSFETIATFSRNLCTFAVEWVAINTVSHEHPVRVAFGAARLHVLPRDTFRLQQISFSLARSRSQMAGHRGRRKMQLRKLLSHLSAHPLSICQFQSDLRLFCL